MVALACMIVMCACSKSDPAPDVTTVQLGKLSRTWKATDVKLNGDVQTGYSDFKLTLSGHAGASSFDYSTSGRPDNSSWMASGSWSFGTPPETTLVRDPATSNARTLTYSVSDSQLVVSFTFTGPGFSGGRVSSLEGEWSFTFAPL
jgi:hypothetical protein